MDIRKSVFINKNAAREIHGDKYNYGQVGETHVENNRSKIQVTCTKCRYTWNPTTSDHINSKSGCPSCSGNTPWTLEGV